MIRWSTARTETYAFRYAKALAFADKEVSCRLPRRIRGLSLATPPHAATNRRHPWRRPLRPLPDWKAFLIAGKPRHGLGFFAMSSREA